MSRLPKPRGAAPPSSTGIPSVRAIPSASGIAPARPDSSRTSRLAAPTAAASSTVRPKTNPSKASMAGTGAKKKVPCQDKKSKKSEVTQIDEGEKLPAFSIPLKQKASKKEAAQREKEKKKLIRRNKPPGEDINKLKEIVRSIRGQNITVQEFIGLISPSSGDNGDLLRFVLAEDLATFRNTSRKIYETMTQDVSDVLTNEHIQLTENSQERHQLLTEKMMRCINEVYQYCPDFNFERFYTQENYLRDKFPVAPEFDDKSEEAQALLRQEAYHRYQWLKSEGDRLKEENTNLQRRVNQLKRQQRDELKMVAQREQQAEEKREKLEETQEELEEKLEELNNSVEKSLVEAELETVKLEKMAAKQVVTGAKRSMLRTGAIPKRGNWAAQTAADIETTSAQESYKFESSKISIKAKSSLSKTSLRAKSRKPRPKPPRAGETSPFHYSPVKSPERRRQSPRQTSPFHYSPPKSPQYYQMQDEAGARVRVESSTATLVEQAPGHSFRRGNAPRDTWSGFR